MGDSYSEEAWLSLNHLSSIMAFGIMDEVYRKGKSSPVSLEEFIPTLSPIHACKIEKSRHLEKATSERAAFAALFGLDLHVLIASLNEV